MAMLDPELNYSCGYWYRADNLADAQRDKLELICRKLELQPGQLLLDIGCGWGALLRHAAEHHGVRAIGVTLPEAQARYAHAACRGPAVAARLRGHRELAA